MITDIERLHNLLNQSMTLLDEVAELVGSIPLEPKRQNLINVGNAIGHILHVRKFVYDVAPELRDVDQK